MNKMRKTSKKKKIQEDKNAFSMSRHQLQKFFKRRDITSTMSQQKKLELRNQDNVATLKL